MTTIILPGYSLHNRDWAYEVAENLQGNVNGRFVVHEWEHWKSGKNLDAKKEVKRILLKVTNDKNDKVNFIAKSVGTKILMSVVPQIKDRVGKVILCGIPIDPVGYARGIKTIGSTKLVIFQNSKDPFMQYKLIKLYIGMINKHVKVVEKKRSDHEYPYFEDFATFLKA